MTDDGFCTKEGASLTNSEVCSLSDYVDSNTIDRGRESWRVGSRFGEENQ